MNTPATVNKETRKVESAIFCNEESQIMQYKVFSTPLPQERINLEQISKYKFDFVLLTFSDKSEFIYRSNSEKFTA